MRVHELLFELRRYDYVFATRYLRDVRDYALHIPTSTVRRFD